MVTISTKFENVRIEGCGTVLKTEYISNDQKVRIHVYPQMDKLRVNYTLSLNFRRAKINVNPYET